MTFTNKVTVNFSGGEVAPGVVSRFDLPIFSKVTSRMQNFIADPKGPAEYRQGTAYVHHTRGNAAARFIEFQFSDQQSYLIEATDLKFRFYKDNALILNSTTKTITGITKANPAVVTSNTHGYTNGQEVYITGVGGMTEVNGRFFIVAGVTANTFQLTNVFGTNINSTSYTTYTSGGTAANVYEITTPYTEASLPALNYAQNADTMYITHPSFEPRKLNRSAHDQWSLNTHTRTNDPFASGSKSISGATRSATARLQVNSHGWSPGTQITITGVVGMTQLNGNSYLVGAVLGPNDFYINNLSGVPIDSTGYTAYTSGGTAATASTYPSCVGFTSDARLMFAGTADRPETIWFSRSPSTTGAIRFDDFTTGSLATDAMTFTLAPLRGRVDSIRWITSTDKFIAVGTFGSIRRLYGATEAAPVEADAVTAKSANSDGVYSTRPAVSGSALFYISRSQQALEAIEYDYAIDGYAPEDKNIIASHLSIGGIKQVVRQSGRPALLWVLREDGVLLGLTYEAKEKVLGWHQHRLGNDGFVEYLGVMPRENAQDQLWVVVRRTIGGNTVRYVEYLTDRQIYKDRLDYYLASFSKAADDLLFANYMYEVLKTDNRLDSALYYDGAAYGRDASATLTPGAGATVQGTTGVTFTASAAVFTSSMVGREIWGKFTSGGVLGGKATITGYTSSTVVTCTITRYFENLSPFAAGDWYITATTVSNLHHLEGQSVRVIADGFDQSNKTVSNGAITISSAKSHIWVGFPYIGVLRLLPLEQGGVSGPGQNKRKSVAEIAYRLINTQKFSFGTDTYHLKEVDTENSRTLYDSPGPLYTGEVKLAYDDGWDDSKELIIYHDDPVPCTIAAIDIYLATADE